MATKKKTARIGRPHVPEAEQRKELISVWATSETKARVVQAAKLSGRPVAQWAALVLDAAAAEAIANAKG
jgi:hypothetical protein